MATKCIFWSILIHKFVFSSEGWGSELQKDLFGQNPPLMECIRCRINWTDAEKLHVPEPPSTLSEIFKVQIYYIMAVEKPIGEKYDLYQN